MISRSAITKVKALFIIDVIIVAVAVGIFLYIQNTGELAVASKKPAEFTVTDLTISPLEAGVGEPILISVNVTNVGDEEGSYSVNFTIDDAMKETKIIQLSGGNSSVVEFTDIENAEGNYFVKIDGLNGTFTITNVPPPSTLRISNLINSPYEAWVNETITISVEVGNIGSEALSYSVAFRVNDVVRVVKAIQLSAGETQTVNCTVAESSEGTYSVSVGGLHGTFIIVPTGKHTLIVNRSGSGSTPLPFTLNGVSHNTPYTELLPVGEYTITVPDPYSTETALFKFAHWENGDTSTIRTINLQSRMALVAQYNLISGYASCPSLFIWNGTNYVYVTEVSSRGYLGTINYINEDGWPVFWRNYPWDYIKLTDRGQLQPRNGYYDFIMTERADEIFYLDAAYMLVVDHPSDVNVYSTMGEQYIDPNFMGQIYTVSKNPLTPISAVNEKGEDVLPQISKLDGVFTPGINGIYSESIYNISGNRLTLNLGDLSNATQIKLIVNGITDWGPDEDQSNWYGSFFTQPVPNGTQPTPKPFMEVKDENGNWVPVPESRQFPLLPDTQPRTFVVDLTGLFPTNDYSLRINNFWNVTFDCIGVDATPQENVTIQRIDLAYASLGQAADYSSSATGNFTRYGDVTQLVLNADDKFVIGKQGDKVSLLFPANIAPPAEGMKRDFFLIDSLWFKEEGNPAVEFTVDPLPFHDMNGFPYPPTDSYPYDEDHLSYLREYNTRTVPVLSTQLIVGDMLGGTIITGLELAGILATLVWTEERAWRGRLPRIKSVQG
jgi:hypothetical protein